MLTILLVSLAALQSPPSIGLDRFEVDARTSTIGFDGTSTLHDFTGKTHAISGDLRADSVDPGRLVGGAVWIEASTLDTGNESRDGEMRDLLEAKQYPQIVFRLDSVVGRLEAGKGDLTGRGRFTIKGVEKERVVHFHIEPLPATNGEIGHGLHVKGETRFDMTDHGIKRPGILIAKVADEVRVWFDLTLRPVTDAGVDALVRTLQVEDEFVPTEKDSAARTVSGTEFVWTSGEKRLWTRRLEPQWIEQGATGLSTIDPRDGSSRATSELVRQVMAQVAKPITAGTTWSTSVDEPGGRRTLRITFSAEVTARAPTWAFDPHAWANGPAPAPVR